MAQYLNWLVRMSVDFESNITSVERIKEYCETPKEESWIIEKSRPAKSWPNIGNIVFKNFSLKYRDELDFVIKDISCEIKSGEKVIFYNLRYNMNI